MGGILLWGEFCYGKNFAMKGILLWEGFSYGGSLWGISMKDQYGGSGGVKFHST